ncbi:hypothetical protein DZG01_18140 [Pseudomonas fluorescens]|nr:hypothetical protein DZG01_18140 [Pseudomonas fluorescens]
MNLLLCWRWRIRWVFGRNCWDVVSEPICADRWRKPGITLRGEGACSRSVAQQPPKDRSAARPSGSKLPRHGLCLADSLHSVSPHLPLNGTPSPADNPMSPVFSSVSARNVRHDTARPSGC